MEQNTFLMSPEFFIGQPRVNKRDFETIIYIEPILRKNGQIIKTEKDVVTVSVLPLRQYTEVRSGKFEILTEGQQKEEMPVKFFQARPSDYSCVNGIYANEEPSEGVVSIEPILHIRCKGEGSTKPLLKTSPIHLPKADKVIRFMNKYDPTSEPSFRWEEQKTKTKPVSNYRYRSVIM